MIQLNLLPDVKVQYIKAKKAKRTIMMISVFATAISVGLLVIMISATLFQKHHISDLDKDIRSYQSSIRGTKDIAKILTIQNQLQTLPSLYAARPVASRLSGYIEATTPKEVSMTKLEIDFDVQSITVEGTADTLESVNRYVDTLKFTTYTDAENKDEKPKAFSQVVLTDFGRDSKIATFTVNMTYDTNIFDASKTITLNVPKTITTRSQTELPTGVFSEGGAK